MVDEGEIIKEQGRGRGRALRKCEKSTVSDIGTSNRNAHRKRDTSARGELD